MNQQLKSCFVFLFLPEVSHFFFTKPFFPVFIEICPRFGETIFFGVIGKSISRFPTKKLAWYVFVLVALLPPKSGGIAPKEAFLHVPRRILPEAGRTVALDKAGRSH